MLPGFRTAKNVGVKDHGFSCTKGKQCLFAFIFHLRWIQRKILRACKVAQLFKTQSFSPEKIVIDAWLSHAVLAITLRE